MGVSVHAGSVLDVPADAIVNAANTELRHGGGVAAAIAAAAGPELVADSRRVAPCPLGSAAATVAGRLPVRCVIHVPTVDYRAGRAASAAELTAGTAAALDLARARGCRRVAFPLLGAGIAGTDATSALRAMVAAFAADLDIVVCAYAAADRRAAATVLGQGSDDHAGGR